MVVQVEGGRRYGSASGGRVCGSGGRGREGGCVVVEVEGGREDGW